MISVNLSNFVPKVGKGGKTILRFSVTLLFNGSPLQTTDGNLYYNDRSVNPPRIPRGPQLAFYAPAVLVKIKEWLDANEEIQAVMGEVELRDLDKHINIEGEIAL